MKSPDDIKKGLEFCSRLTCGEKNVDCPYECGNSECISHLTADALALIQQLQEDLQLEKKRTDALAMELAVLKNAKKQLEDHMREATKKVKQLEAEREAAVSDILYAASVYLGECNTCKNGEVCAACKRQDACDECPNSKCMCSGCGAGRSNWQWRGVQKEPEA